MVASSIVICGGLQSTCWWCFIFNVTLCALRIDNWYY